MSHSNKIRITDRIRTWLASEGREEASTLDQDTTRMELCLLSNNPTDYSLQKLCKVIGEEYICVGDYTFDPPKESMLIDVQSGREEHFPSIKTLERYISCGVGHYTLSRLLSRGGCIIEVQGRQKYLVPNRDVDLPSLGPCPLNIVNIRLRMRYLGYDVASMRSIRELANIVPIDRNPIDMYGVNCDLMRKICEFLGIEYYPWTRVLLTSISIIIFENSTTTEILAAMILL